MLKLILLYTMSNVKRKYVQGGFIIMSLKCPKWSFQASKSFGKTPPFRVRPTSRETNFENFDCFRKFPKMTKYSVLRGSFSPLNMTFLKTHPVYICKWLVQSDWKYTNLKFLKLMCAGGCDLLKIKSALINIYSIMSLTVYSNK